MPFPPADFTPSASIFRPSNETAPGPSKAGRPGPGQSNHRLVQRKSRRFSGPVYTVGATWHIVKNHTLSYNNSKGYRNMKLYRYLAVVVLGLVVPVLSFAQNQFLDSGRFSFSLSPKVLKDGSITDLSFGYEYTEKFGGELRFRYSTMAKNEQFDETVPDSLNAIDESSLEVFLLPFEYFFLKKPQAKFWTGIGGYYNYRVLNEKGYFNMSALEALNKEKVNSYANDFSMHVVGPDIETGFTYRAAWLNVSVHAGIVPVFYLIANQKMTITPLMEPGHANYSQQTSGSPYFYADLTVILFKYISLSFLYDFSRLNYKVIDFDSDLNWYNPERTAITQSLKIEASLLIPLQGPVYTQIGYGHTFDSTQLDSASPAETSRQYLILAAKIVY
jgi:hypothetical protein